MKTRLMSEERAEEGVYRLLNAPLDLALSGARVVSESASPENAPRHKALFSSYRKDLRKAIPEALAWWNDLIEAAKEEYRTEKRALMETWRERPAGPVSDPALVALIRRYWLQCDSLNREGPAGSQVAPHVFLLQWLLEAGDDEAAEILSGMPYWPIGLDPAGNWV